jgi:hypothetical protein
MRPEAIKLCALLMTTLAVTTLAPVSMIALPLSTTVRADESDTPISSEITTKVFRGTRNRAESYT